MGSIITKFQTPSPDYHSDMEMGIPTEPPSNSEPQLYVDPQCSIRNDSNNVYIVAPTDSQFYRDVQKFQEYLYSTNNGAILNNICKQYSIDQMQLASAEEMIMNDVLSLPSSDEQERLDEDNEYDSRPGAWNRVYNRKPQRKTGEKSCARINLLALFPIEYSKYVCAEKEKEIERLKLELSALQK